MLERTHRLNAFTRLGEVLRTLKNSEELTEWAYRAHSANNWFVPENVLQSIDSIANNMLDRAQLLRWTELYPSPAKSSKIGVIMAGNIPAVGFHDALCVLISGHSLHAKLSSDDTFLIKALLNKLTEIEPGFANSIHFVDRLNDADAFIATGSNNSSRYFEYYFSKKPHIIRRNRVSVALLTGKEDASELAGLVEDILRYYGLGCRNVAKLLVPEGYDFTKFYDQAESFSSYCLHHHKYFNNYEYNKSIVLINRVPHLDNGFLLVEENPALVSPLSMVYYQTYQKIEDAIDYVNKNEESIQCIVGHPLTDKITIPFGKAQYPLLTDYADGIDTMSFLSKL